MTLYEHGVDPSYGDDGFDEELERYEADRQAQEWAADQAFYAEMEDQDNLFAHCPPVPDTVSEDWAAAQDLLEAEFYCSAHGWRNCPSCRAVSKYAAEGGMS